MKSLKRFLVKLDDDQNSKAHPQTNLRLRFAGYLNGTGIEIGPLHHPIPIPPDVKVSYVDKFSYEKLCQHNPDVPPDQIVRPDIVCDTASLDLIPDCSLDFVIASHLLEHLHNPLKAMLDWHRVLKPGGLVLCIVPDGRYTFDKGRECTPLDHLLWDFVNDGTEMKVLSDLFHIAECNLNMHKSLNPETAMDLAKQILHDSYDTHFHVWTYDAFLNQMRTLMDDFAFPFKIRKSASDLNIEMLFLFEAMPAEKPFSIPKNMITHATR